MSAEKIPFIAAHCLADCAARVFAEHRTKRTPGAWGAEIRRAMRAPAVRALRHLWRTGDAEQRATVAARVGAWMRSSTDHRKIQEREKRRTNGSQNQEQKVANQIA